MLVLKGHPTLQMESVENLACLCRPAFATLESFAKINAKEKEKLNPGKPDNRRDNHIEWKKIYCL